jgi:hypothetical protein
MDKQLEPVVVNPAFNWPLFVKKARHRIVQNKVAVIFGYRISVSRKYRSDSGRIHQQEMCGEQSFLFINLRSGDSV